MRLVPVSQGPTVTIRCIGCGKSCISTKAYADLDGKPFEAYYCADCAEKAKANQS